MIEDPSLYDTAKHPAIPKIRNANLLHKAEQEAAGFNMWLAVQLTKRVGSMWTAYSFIGLAIVGLLAILGLLSPLIALLVAWGSQTFIQLVLLPVIMVGQNVLNRHQELQEEERYKFAVNTYNDTELLKQQNAQIISQNMTIIALLKEQDHA